MSVSNAFRKLARFLDDCESGRRVTGVELSDVSDTGEERMLTADIELTGTTCPATAEGERLSLASTALDDNGALECTFRSVGAVVPSGGDAIEVEASNVAIDGEGSVTVTIAATVRADAEGPDRVDRAIDEESGARVGSDDDGDETTRTGTGGSADGDGGEVDGDGADGMATGTPDEDDPEGDRDLPPFRDRELLSTVYESCDTFAEMADTLDMDVTAETVRRYTIDFGIHEPNTYDTGDDGSEEDGESEGSGEDDESRGVDDNDPASGVDVDAARAGGPDGASGDADDDGETPVMIPDGIGLPEDVTAEGLIETVKQSNTVYEFKRDVGVDRENALEMLRELNLLDLLVGRIATEAERDITRDAIVERLREASAQE